MDEKLDGKPDGRPDEKHRPQNDTQLRDLRLKLKEWELEFAKTHCGRKPTRDDIKRTPQIEKISKRYHKLRNILNGKAPPPPGDREGNHGKRKSPDVSLHTPSSKRARRAETPSSHNCVQIGQASPGNQHTVTPLLDRKLFSPVMPTSIGPTPQRDGRVLGLFDLLPFKDVEIDSPSKPNASLSIRPAPVTTKTTEAVEATPKRGMTLDTDVGTAFHLGRTPCSRSGRQQHQLPLRSTLSTPSKSIEHGPGKTPSTTHSVSKLQFQTPAFLRRIPLPKDSGNGQFASPDPIRLPRKPLVRGLSSLVADLRKTKEEQLDDDLDVLREMENESRPSKSNSKPIMPFLDKPKTTLPSKEVAEVKPCGAIMPKDSSKQSLSLLGGFDDEAMYDDDDGHDLEGLGRDGKPLKIYKKKGQKRTTRKVNMRPVWTKRRQTTSMSKPDKVISDTRREVSRMVQADFVEDPAPVSDANFVRSANNNNNNNNDDDDDDELAREEPETPKRPKEKREAPGKKKLSEDKAEGVVRKATRKVNELAHANFKRLRLRNSGAKGGPGHASRFRRRR